ncbi:hypothetical protein ACHAWF_016570 [Thalassiosira exigua]
MMSSLKALWQPLALMHPLPGTLSWHLLPDPSPTLACSSTTSWPLHRRSPTTDSSGRSYSMQLMMSSAHSLAPMSHPGGSQCPSKSCGKLVLDLVIDSVNLTIHLPPPPIEWNILQKSWPVSPQSSDVPTPRSSTEFWGDCGLCPMLCREREISSVPCKRLSLKKSGPWVALNKGVHHALDGFCWLHANISKRPTRMAKLISLAPSTEGHHDTSGTGKGEVWFPSSLLVPRRGCHACQPLLWRLRWPEYITKRLVTESNPNGTITNSDLELAGGLLHLDAITQALNTFLHMGTEDPRLNTAGKINFRITWIIAAWKKDDPAPMSYVILRTFCPALSSNQSSPPCYCGHYYHFILFSPTAWGIYTLVLRYYSIHLELYSALRWNNTTVPLDCSRMPTAPIPLQLPDRHEQKKGVYGKVIGLGCSSDPYLCPVRYWSAASSTCGVKLQAHTPDWPGFSAGPPITLLLCQTVCYLGTTLGFHSSVVSTRCICAVGITAILIGKVDTGVIRLGSRWRSDEMIHYLHVQAATLMSDYTRRMLHTGDYSLILHQLVPQR